MDFEAPIVPRPTKTKTNGKFGLWAGGLERTIEIVTTFCQGNVWTRQRAQIQDRSTTEQSLYFQRQ